MVQQVAKDMKSSFAKPKFKKSNTMRKPNRKPPEKLPKLDRRIMFVAVVNTISLVVSLRQMYLDIIWNMNVKNLHPENLFSCSEPQSVWISSKCCRPKVLEEVNKMYDEDQIRTRYVLSFIVMAGMSVFAFLFNIGGFCVGFGSKYRNILMYPIFTIGVYAHVINCVFFIIGLFWRQQSHSSICTESNPSLAVTCIKQVLSCQDLDWSFKYWFILSVSWTVLAIGVLGGFGLFTRKIQISKLFSFGSLDSLGQSEYYF